VPAVFAAFAASAALALWTALTSPSANATLAATHAPLRFISDLHRACAVPERLIRNPELLEHREQQVRQRGLLRHLDVPVALELAGRAARQNDWQRVVVVLVAVAHAAAVHHE